jgi:hypothetical protein
MAKHPLRHGYARCAVDVGNAGKGLRDAAMISPVDVLPFTKAPI